MGRNHIPLKKYCKKTSLLYNKLLKPGTVRRSVQIMEEEAIVGKEMEKFQNILCYQVPLIEINSKGNRVRKGIPWANIIKEEVIDNSYLENTLEKLSLEVKNDKANTPQFVETNEKIPKNISSLTTKLVLALKSISSGKEPTPT